MEAGWDGRLKKLSKSFVVAKLDTLNGQADFIDDLDVHRNTGYVLILDPVQASKPNQNEAESLKELFRLVNSKLTIDEVTELIAAKLDVVQEAIENQ